MTNRVLDLEEYAAGLEAELRDRTATLERDVALANAQVDRLLALVSSMDDDFRAKLAKADALAEALSKIDDMLTNMQPVIANGLLDETQLQYVDSYVDPCVLLARSSVAAYREEDK